jgi:hypothetical protein
MASLSNRSQKRKEAVKGRHTTRELRTEAEDSRLTPGLWLFTWIPVRHEVRVHQPEHRGQQGLYCLIHVPKVDVRDVVAGLVIVLMKAIAGNGLSDHSGLGENVIVRAFKKLLVRVRIASQPRSALG